MTTRGRKITTVRRGRTVTLAREREARRRGRKFRRAKPELERAIRYREVVTGATKRVKRRARRKLLGKMGELGPDLIFEFWITKKGHKELKQLGVSKSSIWREIRAIHDDLKREMSRYIDAWAPRDSGDLRQAMKDALDPPSSRITQTVQFTSGSPFRTVMNTKGINYAAVVNRMPEQWLIHPAPYHRNRGPKTKNPLVDPKAREGFYDLVVALGRKQAELFYKGWIKRNNIPSDLEQKEFKVKFR